jgi:hypothetical protein
MPRQALVALLLAPLAACGQSDADQAAEAGLARRLPRHVDPEWVHFTPPAVTVGDLAPDFELVDARGAGTHRLSELRGSPVLLVFASYT